MAQGSLTEWRGLTLPIIRGEDGYFTAQALSKLLYSSIYMIMTTPVGSVLWNPTFGSEVPLLLFEPNDKILENQLRRAIADALLLWEKRIKVTQIIVTPNNKDVNVVVNYTILESGQTVSDEFALSRSR